VSAAGVRRGGRSLVSGVRERLEARRRFASRFQFDDRSTGAETVIVIIAGYREYLWPWTLPRFARAAPPGVDVCLASAGKRLEALSGLAERQGWSYLSTEVNQVSLLQNWAIRLHPHARYVIKIDEDIFVGGDFFTALMEGYRQVSREGRWLPGLCSPVLNLNGYSYVNFLETMGLTDAYVAEFGELLRRSGLVKATDTGQAGLWLWRRSLPFDGVVEHFASQLFAYSAVPHRFSIGAIIFERELWSLAGGFWVAPEAPGLGADEEHICRTCMSYSRPVVVLHNLFAGHFAFGIQEPFMRAALPELAPKLGPREPLL
jgi:hypothetical protein